MKRIAEKVFILDSFQKAYINLAIHSVKKQFQHCLLNVHEGSEIEWAKMLEIANVLAQSNESKYEEPALRIAQHCLVTPELPNSFYQAACVVLDTLTNREAINLAKRKGYVESNILDSIPVPLQMDRIKRELFYTEKVFGHDELLYFNRYQRSLWDSLKESDRLSTSAPTSTGKSFLIKSWIGEFLRNKEDALVVYLVPTRALISQVEKDLKTFLNQNGLLKINVSTVPDEKYIKSSMANVMVLTQERLYLLIAAMGNSLKVDALIVDEAHKIGDGSRGVLLEQAIDAVIENYENCKLIFASPMVENPDILLNNYMTETTQTVKSEHTTVSQNMFWLSQAPRNPKHWKVEYCYKESLFQLGDIKLEHSPNPASKRLPFLAFTMASKEGGNLIYVNGQADAEKTAYQLWSLIGPDGDISHNEEIQDLVDLTKNNIHPKYVLVNMLKRGVAFHYGNMPLNIKDEIEKLYSKGIVKFLICTSTLVEGVNLPCKTIFLRGPKRGRSKPMNEADFWNLCGRAGRLGKEFQGNIVCIDAKNPAIWKTPPPRHRKPQAILPATKEIIGKLGVFESFISNEKVGETTDKDAEVESVYSMLAYAFLRNGSILSAKVLKNLSTHELRNLNHLIKDSLQDVSIPIEIIRKNPGISPVAMQSLLNYFDFYEKDLEELIPPLPESEDAVQLYTRVFARIDKYLSGSFNSAFSDAVVVVSWMRGHPLARIISERIRYKERKKKEYDLSAVIRDTMEDVEKIARFLAPRFTACYLDLLKFSFEKKNRLDLANDLPPLQLWLEFGTSQQSQLSLISLGLSRPAAIAVSEFLNDEKMNEEQVLTWLKSLDVDVLPVPTIIRKEIKTTLQLS